MTFMPLGPIGNWHRNYGTNGQCSWCTFESTWTEGTDFDRISITLCLGVGPWKKETFDFSRNSIITPSGDFKQDSEEF